MMMRRTGTTTRTARLNLLELLLLLVLVVVVNGEEVEEETVEAQVGDDEFAAAAAGNNTDDGLYYQNTTDDGLYSNATDDGLYLNATDDDEFLDDAVGADDDYYYYDDDASFNIAEARTMAYLAKPFALISILCSYVMIREVIADQRARFGTPISHTLFSMAVADVFFSFAVFLGAWPTPSSIQDPYILGNVGNKASCTFQGFLFALGYYASIFFNASLSMLYLLMVKFNWTNRQLKKLEPWQHGTIWTIALGLALYPIPLHLYNSLGDKCAVGCHGDECKNDINPEPHQYFMTMVPWLFLLISVIVMSMLLFAVRKMENKSRKYASSLVRGSTSQTSSMDVNSSVHSSSNRGSAGARSSLVGRLRDGIRRSGGGGGGGAPPPEQPPTTSSVEEQEAAAQRHINRRKSTAVAMQGICYCAAFLMTYSLDMIVTIWWLHSEGYNEIVDHLAYGVLMPSAGTFNFLVFSRTRTKMKTPEGRFVRALFCCMACRTLAKKVQAPRSTARTEQMTNTSMERTTVATVSSTTQRYNTSARFSSNVNTSQSQLDVSGHKNSQLDKNSSHRSLVPSSGAENYSNVSPPTSPAHHPVFSKVVGAASVLRVRSHSNLDDDEKKKRDAEKETTTPATEEENKKMGDDDNSPISTIGDPAATATATATATAAATAAEVMVMEQERTAAIQQDSSSAHGEEQREEKSDGGGLGAGDALNTSPDDDDVYHDAWQDEEGRNDNEPLLPHDQRNNNDKNESVAVADYYSKDFSKGDDTINLAQQQVSSSENSNSVPPPGHQQEQQRQEKQQEQEQQERQKEQRGDHEDDNSINGNELLSCPSCIDRTSTNFLRESSSRIIDDIDDSADDGDNGTTIKEDDDDANKQPTAPLSSSSQAEEVNNASEEDEHDDDDDSSNNEEENDDEFDDEGSSSGGEGGSLDPREMMTRMTSWLFALSPTQAEF